MNSQNGHTDNYATPQLLQAGYRTDSVSLSGISVLSGVYPDRLSLFSNLAQV